MNRSLMIQVNGWLLLLPALVLLVMFTHYPIVKTVIHSLFSNGNAILPTRFVGLGNYADMIHDPVFWQVVKNNLLYAAISIPITVGISMLMATWANRHMPGRALTRMAYFTPTMLPMIAVANIWLFFYSPGIGILDQIGALFGAGRINWLGNPDTALASVMVLNIWKQAGFFMIFYLAALQSIPPELQEAARMEGAGRWYFFRRVTLPLLMPTTLFVLVNATINSFTIVDQLFILTRGGPDNATNLLLYYIYQVAFQFLNTPYAATLTVVLVGFLALVAVAQFFLLDRRIHYQ